MDAVVDISRTTLETEKSGFQYYRDIVFPTRWGENKPGKLYLLERKK